MAADLVESQPWLVELELEFRDPEVDGEGGQILLEPQHRQSQRPKLRPDQPEPRHI